MSAPTVEPDQHSDSDSKRDQLNFLLDRFANPDSTNNLQPFAYEPRSLSSGQRKPNDVTLITQHHVIDAVKHELCDYDRAMYIANHYRRSTSDNYDAELFFLRYDVPHHVIEDDELLNQALDFVTNAFRPKSRIRPVHFADLLSYNWNLSTSAERPYTNNHHLQDFIHDLYKIGLLRNAKMSFHNLFNWIFGKERSRIHQIKDGHPPNYDYITMHQKTALIELGEPNKVRSVFGVPKLLIFSEAMFFWPLFREYLNEGTSPLLWGYETLNGGWMKLSNEIHSARLHHNTWGSLDWKEFDMRFYFSLHRKIRARWLEYFTFDNGYIPSGDYYSEEKMADEARIIDSTRSTPQAQRLLNLWNYCTVAVEDSPCILPSGRVYKRKFAGQPSGIFTTQFGDSFYNATMVITILLEMGFTIDDKFMFKTMGDDILFLLLCLIPPNQHEMFLERFAFVAKRRFNAIVSIKKTRVGNGIHRASILSYMNVFGLPYRDGNLLLAQLFYTKGFRDTPSRAMARAIGIAFACGPFNFDVYRCCKAVYNRFKLMGYSANSKELDWMFKANLLGNSQVVETERFPSLLEVHKKLTQIPSRSERANNLYWPAHHFHSYY